MKISRNDNIYLLSLVIICNSLFQKISNLLPMNIEF